MEDPIPAGFITLPEALQRIADCVSEAHVESAKSDFQANVHAIAQTRRGEGQSATATPESPKSEGADSETYARPSQDALLHWNKRNFAVTKLTLALQTGAISAMVRSPESGGLFRLTPTDWHFEPFREQIVRGGVIPPYASRGFERHGGRTVLLEARHFETWIVTDVKNWTEASTDELCRKWLIQEMLGSPNNKKKSKNAWFEQAKKKYRLSRREFDRAWSHARNQTQSNWGRPGAPNNHRASHRAHSVIAPVFFSTCLHRLPTYVLSFEVLRSSELDVCVRGPL